MNNSKVKRLVGIALMMALIVVLQALSAAIPPIGGFPISLVLIPIVLGGAMYGIRAGALLGAVFGIVVYVNCYTGADPGGHMVFTASPPLCFLVVMAKGILAGSLSSLVYGAIKRLNDYVAMLIAAIVCPVVNTGTFLAGMFLFFRPVLAAWADGSDLITYALSGIVLINFVPELIINIAFSPAGNTILRAVNKR